MVAEKTAINFRGPLLFAAPCTPQLLCDTATTLCPEKSNP